jgi:hypothetical protein
MKHGLLDDATVAEMLDDDALEQRRCHTRIPHALGVHGDDRPSAAHAEAGRLTPLHAAGPEEQPLALKQRGKLRIESATPTVRRAEAADAHEDVAAVGLHDGGRGPDHRRLTVSAAKGARDGRPQLSLLTPAPTGRDRGASLQPVNDQ